MDEPTVTILVEKQIYVKGDKNKKKVIQSCAWLKKEKDLLGTAFQHWVMIYWEVSVNFSILPYCSLREDEMICFPKIMIS